MTRTRTVVTSTKDLWSWESDDVAAVDSLATAAVNLRTGCLGIRMLSLIGQSSSGSPQHPE